MHACTYICRSDINMHGTRITVVGTSCAVYECITHTYEKRCIQNSWGTVCRVYYFDTRLFASTEFMRICTLALGIYLIVLSLKGKAPLTGIHLLLTTFLRASWVRSTSVNVHWGRHIRLTHKQISCQR